MRKTCSNYTEALQVFDQKGGDEARNYLYQREYDRLDQRGRARYVLAALALLNVPVSYRVLCNVLNCPEEQVRDALTEISGIFVNSIITEGGDTQYQISPTSHRHIMSVSQNLQFMARLKRTIEFFRNETAKLTPEEASIIQRMERFIRLKNWEKVINIAGAVETDHTAQSTLGSSPR